MNGIENTEGMKDTLAKEGPEHHSAAAARHRDLDQALVKGLAWTAAAKWSGQMLTWISTIIVARLLSPEDYGLVAMALVVVGLIELLNEFGMGAAIVRHRDLSDKQIAQINGLCFLVGLGGCAITVAAAWPTGYFYGTPELPYVLMVLSANFIITSFRTVPLALLQRDLQFRTAALNDAFQAIAQSIATVVLAALGFKYWTLVCGVLVGGLLSTLLAYRYRPRPLAWPRRRDIGEAITFGGHIVGWRVGWYACSQSDLIIAGKLLGERALGAYSLAMTIARIPSEKVTALIMRVAPAVLSAVQNDLPALRRYLLNITEMLALITMPAAIGIALVAPDFVVLVLGEHWRPAIIPMQILAIESAFGAIIPVIPSVAQAVGMARQGMVNALLKALVMPPAFIVGSHWGIEGIAATWLIVHPLVAIPFYALVFRRIELRAVDYFRSLAPALTGTLLMTAAFFAVQHYAWPFWSPLVVMLLGIAAAAVTYGVALLLLHRQRVHAVVAMMRTLRAT
jgi:PST family polysaccharide transporter